MPTKQIKRFTAYDKAGKPVVLIQYQEFVNAGGYGGDSFIPGWKFIRTADGATVNVTGKGMYQAIGTNGSIDLHCTDADAP
jgi:hypothetical protein